jgi:hypothetical protein
MGIRVTRPGFMQGIADLAASAAPVWQFPSIESWRRGSRERPYDPNRDASRQAQAAALRLRAPAAPSTATLPTEGVQGVTPTTDGE